MPVKSPFDVPQLRSELQKMAFIALGSNLGDPKQNVLRAMDRLQQITDFPLLRSSFWQSTPVECPPGSPLFVNAAAGLMPRTDETPESLLKKLQALEVEFGRQPRNMLNEPRPLDLDLIALRQETRHSQRVTPPHPRRTCGGFFCQPLPETRPPSVLPGRTPAILRWLGNLDSSERLLRPVGNPGPVA